MDFGVESVTLLAQEAFFDLIPEELVFQILFCLDAPQLLAFGQTCKRYLELSKIDEVCMYVVRCISISLGFLVF
jgi:hypothetical protein